MKRPIPLELGNWAQDSPARRRINVNDGRARAPLHQDQAILIGLGANLDSLIGPPVATLEAALTRLEAEGIRVAARSRWRRTPPWPPGSDQPDYVNGAALLETDLAPEDLLAALLETEAEMGRVREAVWAPRVCDLDLLTYGQTLRPELEEWRRLAEVSHPPEGQPFLVLPHPRLHLRFFALEPAAELAPQWRHPVFGRALEEMAGLLRG